MAIIVGSVVWLNSGPGPWTVVEADEKTVVCTEGKPTENRRFPIEIMTETDPNPALRVKREIAEKEATATIETAVAVIEAKAAEAKV